VLVCLPVLVCQVARLPVLARLPGACIACLYPWRESKGLVRPPSSLGLCAARVSGNALLVTRHKKSRPITAGPCFAFMGASQCKTLLKRRKAFCFSVSIAGQRIKHAANFPFYSPLRKSFEPFRHDKTCKANNLIRNAQLECLQVFQFLVS